MKEKTLKLIPQVQELINTSNRIVVLTGAGVSTESNIPDFRGKDGIYNKNTSDKMKPEDVLSARCIQNHPGVFYDFYRKYFMADAEPNRIHKKIFEFEKAGRVSAVITQNIDGLHQKAGSEEVLEVHGTLARNYCMKCRKAYDTAYLRSALERDNEKHTYPKCDCDSAYGIIRPDVVLYDEMLPGDVVAKSEHRLMLCDLLIILGTSLTVYPVANFPQFVGWEVPVLYINNDIDAKYFRKDSWICIEDSIGDVLDVIEVSSIESNV